MKKLNFIAIVFIGLFVFSVKVKAQVGIGTSTPDSSSILELKSENQGLLLPRVNDLNSIKKAKEGLLIYNQTEGCISIYKGSESGWQCLETTDNDKEKSPQVVEVKNEELVEREIGHNYFVLNPNNKEKQINLKFPVPLLGDGNVMVEINNNNVIGKDNEYAEKATGKSFILNNGTKVRYIRNSINGSNKNIYSHWVEVKAIDANNNNVAKGKPVIDSRGKTSAISETHGVVQSSIITDESLSTKIYYGLIRENFITVDLQQVYEINKIIIWHYYGDFRRYHGNVVEISTDGVNWTTIFSTKENYHYPIKKLSVTTEGNGGKEYIYNNFPYGKVLKFYYNNGWKTLNNL